MTRAGANEQRTEMWRVFCAVELSSEVRSKIEIHIKQLRAAVPEAHASWSRIENIHLTMKFFGDVSQKRIPVISKAAHRAIEQLSPFEVVIAKSGAFPKASHARVLWIGVTDEQGKLTALHKRFEEECKAEGFSKEERAFRPHLTIARIRDPKGARALAELNQKLDFETIPLAVTELVVFRSELSSKGSTYTALSRARMSDEL